MKGIQLSNCEHEVAIKMEDVKTMLVTNRNMRCQYALECNWQLHSYHSSDAMRKLWIRILKQELTYSNGYSKWWDIFHNGRNLSTKCMTVMWYIQISSVSVRLLALCNIYNLCTSKNIATINIGWARSI